MENQTVLESERAEGDRYVRTFLPSDQIEWVGVRFADRVGRCFIYNGRYHKAIYRNAADHFVRLYQNGVYSSLIEEGLMPDQEIASYTVEGFPFVISQDTDYWSVKVNQWNPSLLRDACLLWIRINQKLLPHGLGLVDGQSANYVVQGACQVKWCDVGSILPLGGDGAMGIAEFIKFAVYPLLVRAKSADAGRTSRLLIEGGVSREEASFLLGGQLEINGSRESVLERLSGYIKGIEIPWEKTTWSEYHGAFFDQELKFLESVTGAEVEVDRNVAVNTILESLAPQTVADLGANAGYFSLMAAKNGASVLAVELDERAATRCFENVKTWGRDFAPIQVAIDGFSAPLPKKPNGVMALALTHHLFFTHGFRLDVQAKCFSEYDSEWVLVEFMVNGMGGTKPHPDPLPPHYSLKIFVEEFERFFPYVMAIDPVRPEGSSHRVLVLASKSQIPEMPTLQHHVISKNCEFADAERAAVSNCLKDDSSAVENRETLNRP